MITSELYRSCEKIFFEVGVILVQQSNSLTLI
jgi:hypothetical protein